MGEAEVMDGHVCQWCGAEVPYDGWEVHEAVCWEVTGPEREENER